MVVKGRKFVELTGEERSILTSAVEILNNLADEVGADIDDCYDITITAEQIVSIRDVGEFTIELGEDY